MKLVSICLWALVVTVAAGCRPRVATGSGVFEDTAAAQDRDGDRLRVLTSDGAKAYPTRNMIRASYNTLGKMLALFNQASRDGERALTADEVREFRSLMRATRLNLAMRKAPKRPVSTGAAGGGSKLRCTIASIAGSTSDSTIFDVRAEEGSVASSTRGVTIGPENYSFDASIQDESDGSRTLSVFFYENNVAQDEVGGTSCTVPEDNSEFCSEKLENENGPIADFWCQRFN